MFDPHYTTRSEDGEVDGPSGLVIGVEFGNPQPAAIVYYDESEDEDDYPYYDEEEEFWKEKARSRAE